MSSPRLAAIAVLLLACGSAAGADAPTVSPATTFAEAGMVDIRSLVPDIA
ncbi:MAG: peptidase M15, partial [Lysobacteraceae bacterium]